MVSDETIFGDRRVDRSCGFLHQRLVRHGPRGLSIRRLGGSRAGEVRIGRFLRNDKVTVDKIVDQAASGFEQARWITQLYRRRWVIEQLLRTIKSKGFDIERVSIETAPFTTLCAMPLVAGVSCMQMVQDRDGGERGYQINHDV